MIRTHALAALAVLAMGFLVATPADAGGSSSPAGVKKNAIVVIRNTTASPYYVLLIPQALASNTKLGTPGSVRWARNLGAVTVSPGASVGYPVPAGPGGILVYRLADVPSNPNAQLPDDPEAGAPATGGDYTVARGSRITKTITAGPVIE